MRLALIADVHGNLHALRAVLAAIRDDAPDVVACAGDLVGYGPFPNECVELVARHGMACVAGNHDLVAIGRLTPSGWGRVGTAAAARVRAELGFDAARFLAQLPDRLTIDAVVVTHGGLGDPTRYVTTPAQACSELERLSRDFVGARLLVVGHSHRPWACSARGTAHDPVVNAPVYDFDRAVPHLLNPGSVGQSRSWERRPQARYLLIDLTACRAAWRAVDYDVEACREALAARGLPGYLIHFRPGLPGRALARIEDAVRQVSGTSS